MRPARATKKPGLPQRLFSASQAEDAFEQAADAKQEDEQAVTPELFVPAVEDRVYFAGEYDRQVTLHRLRDHLQVIPTAAAVFGLFGVLRSASGTVHTLTLPLKY